MHLGAFIKLLCVWLGEHLCFGHIMCIRERMVYSVKYMLIRVSEHFVICPLKMCTYERLLSSFVHG